MLGVKVMKNKQKKIKPSIKFKQKYFEKGISVSIFAS